MTESAVSASPPSRQRLARLGFVLAVLLAVAISQTAILSWVAGHLVPWAAARSGYNLSAERVRTAISRPLVLEKVRVNAADGTSLQAERVEVVLTAPWHWLQSPCRLLQKVEVRDLAGNIAIEEPKASRAKTSGRALGAPFTSLALVPRVLDITASKLSWRHGVHSLTMGGVEGRLDEDNPGVWQARSVGWRSGDWQKDWTDRQAVTGWSGGSLYLADLDLGDNVAVDSFSLALVGPPEATLASTAFGGYMQADLAFEDAAIKVAVNAWNLSLDQAGRFLAWPDGLQGRVDTTKFIFNGDPQHPADAQVALRAEVRDFAAGPRAFAEAKLGLSLAGRKLQVDQFLLQQPANVVDLSGWVTLPAEGGAWSEAPFQAAWRLEVGDLSALAALVGDRGKNSAGAVQAHGAVAGTARDSKGWSSLRGWNLRLRGMPVNWLQADAFSNGRDISLAGIEAWSGVNFLRGEGLVSISDKLAYQGRLELRVREIARYLEPIGRFAPDWAREGSVLLFWEGDGAGDAHSGVASLELVKFTGDLNPVPVNANLVATYSPGNIYVSRFLLDRGPLSLSSVLYFGAKGLSMQDIQLFSGRTRLLRGELFLPVSLDAVLDRRAWGEVIMPSNDVYASVRSEDLELGSLVELFGQETTLRGRVDLRLDASGPWENAVVDGRLFIAGLRAKLPSFSLPPSRAELTLQAKDCRASLAAKLIPEGGEEVQLTANLPLMGEGADGGWTMIDGLQPWDMRLSVPSLDLASFGPKVGVFRLASGEMRAEIKASHTPFEPHLDGTIEWTEGRLEAAKGWEPLTDVQAKVVLAGTQATLEGTRMKMGEGTLSLGGQMSFGEMARPSYDLSARGANLRFFRNDDLLLQGGLQLTAKGGGESGAVDGVVDLIGSRVLRRLVVTPETQPAPTDGWPVPPGFSLAPFSAWNTTIRLTASQPVAVGPDRNSGLLRPNLQIEGTLGQPLLLGDVGVENLSVILPSGVSLHTHGTLPFTRDLPWQPLLDLTGAGAAGAFQIAATASGPLAGGALALSSSPSLTARQLVLLLNTGIVPSTARLEIGAAWPRLSAGARPPEEFHLNSPAEEVGFRWSFR